MSSEVAAVEAKVRGYILENLMFSSNPEDLSSSASLLELGVIDSTGVLEIILYIEDEFGIQVKASEMLPENFDSVDNMTRFIRRQQVAA